MIRTRRTLVEIADYIDYLAATKPAAEALASLAHQFRTASNGELSTNIADGLIMPISRIYDAKI